MQYKLQMVKDELKLMSHSAQVIIQPLVHYLNTSLMFVFNLFDLHTIF